MAMVGWLVGDKYFCAITPASSFKLSVNSHSTLATQGNETLHSEIKFGSLCVLYGARMRRGESKLPFMDNGADSNVNYIHIDGFIPKKA